MAILLCRERKQADRVGGKTRKPEITRMAETIGLKRKGV